MGVDHILDEKFAMFDTELDKIWKQEMVQGDEFRFDDVIEKQDQIRQAIDGKLRNYEVIPESQSLNVKHVIKNKAINDKNFDLYEQVQYMSNDEAITALKELQ